MHDEALAKAICDDYIKGVSYKKLTQRYSCSDHYITKTIKKAGIPVRRKRNIIPVEEYETIKQLREDGMYINDIATKYNCSHIQIINILDKLERNSTEKSMKHYNAIPSKPVSSVHIMYSNKFTIGQVVKTTEGKGIITERNKDNFLIQFKNYAESFTLWQLWKANYSVVKEG